MERRVVTQLISCLDGLAQEPKGNQVLVIGATNRPDALDPALRRVGRFDQEISLGIPDRDAREQILRIICQRLSIERPFDFRKLATLTPGYVGADLLALATRAASTAVKKIFTKRGEVNAEKRFLRQQALINKKSTIPTVVNLTDDAILMDVEDEAEVKKDDINPEEKKTEIEKNDKTEDKETPKKDDNDKNEVVDIGMEITEGDGKAEVVEDKEQEDINKKSNSIDKDNVDINMAEDSDNTKKSDEFETEKVDDKIPEVEETEKQNSTKENGAAAEILNNDKEKIEDEILDEIVAITDTIINNSDAVTQKLSELNAAVFNSPGMKYNLTLNEMVSWLSNKAVPLSTRDLDNIYITFDDFLEALKFVQPSAKREGFITVPDVTWNDIGSLRDIREELKLAVLAPVKFPEKLKILGLTAPSGVLLCGPPGCGKTLLAKAVANEAGINFISVKGPELLNMVSVDLLLFASIKLLHFNFDNLYH